MNIFFDVDFTILSWDARLRPGTHRVFARLHRDGHHVYLWSGKGARWGVVRRHQLAPLLSGVFPKPLERFDNALEWMRIVPPPDFVIDDHLEIVRHFGGYHIKEYYYATDDDDELETAYAVVANVTADGHANHPRWHPRPSSSTGPPPAGTRDEAAGTGIGD